MIWLQKRRDEVEGDEENKLRISMTYKCGVDASRKF